MSTLPNFHALFRASPYPYQILDTELNIIAVNQAFLTATGRTEAELLGRYAFDAFPENAGDPGSTNMQQVRESMLRAIASGEPDTLPFLRYAMPRQKDGGTSFEERFWSTVHTPVRDEDGAITCIMQNSIDVTGLYSLDRESHLAALDTAPAARAEHFNQAQMHQAMLRIVNDERSHLRSLFNQSPGFIAVLTGERHVFEMVNEAYYQLVGHRELVGKPVWQALPDLAGQGYEELLDRVRSTGEPFVGRNLKVQVQPVQNGPVFDRFIDLLYQPMYGKDGRVYGIFAQGHDVTDAHTARIKEIESAERLSEGLDAARMMVWDWEIASRKMIFSENASLVLGRSDGDLDGIDEAIGPDDMARLQHARERAVADCSGYQETVRYQRKDDGRQLWLDIRGKVICGPDGQPYAIRGVTLDVTERMRAEEDLREAHRRKDEFLALLAHELRNPLAPISSAAQLLRHAKLDARRLNDITDIIIRQVGHITGLVDDLIDVSRVTRGLISTEQQPHDIYHIVGDAIEQVRPLVQARGHHLTVELAQEPARIMGDHKRVVQVLTNLLNNAAKYTPEGGRIALRMALGETELTLEVSDNGIGIAPELLPRVFDLFTQGERSADRAQGGLGVGLAVVKSLAELHGGRVAAASAGAGMGSTFTLTLPLLAGEAAQGGASAPAIAPQAPSALRVMIVDDNPDAALMLGMLLEAAGYEVATENSSAAGLARAAATLPDVCLLDIGLPGMDGYELARQIRALDGMAGATLVAVTGYGQAQDRRRTHEAGFGHHLVKPVDTGELMALLLAESDARKAAR